MASDTMADLMDDSDRIEQLTPEQVKELFVKNCIWKVYRRELRSKFGPNAFDNPEYDQAMSAFTDQTLDGFAFWLTERSGLGGPVVTMFRDDGPDALDQAFDDLTTPGATVEKARRKLASITRGSMGMPQDKIIRDNLKRMVD